MNILNFRDDRNKKVRGLKRKKRSMLQKIINCTLNFPEENLEDGFWHIHLPVKRSFIDSAKVPFGIKRACMQSLIDRAEHLIKIKPVTESISRVVVLINLSHLWDSEIIVFFGSNHYNGFFDRNNDSQKWLPLPKDRDISIECKLLLPQNFKIRGFKEIINDDDLTYESELWFLGELD
ncbi:MAG: DUF3916 domain-containing protein [Oligoflexia bacterium]|nr:DUF3916 domain-containing protein [Oligoflexia bacterium]